MVGTSSKVWFGFRRSRAHKRRAAVARFDLFNDEIHSHNMIRRGSRRKHKRRRLPEEMDLGSPPTPFPLIARRGGRSGVETALSIPGGEGTNRHMAFVVCIDGTSLLAISGQNVYWRPAVPNVAASPWFRACPVVVKETEIRNKALQGADVLCACMCQLLGKEAMIGSTRVAGWRWRHGTAAGDSPMARPTERCTDAQAGAKLSLADDRSFAETVPPRPDDRSLGGPPPLRPDRGGLSSTTARCADTCRARAKDRPLHRYMLLDTRIPTYPDASRLIDAFQQLPTPLSQPLATPRKPARPAFKRLSATVDQFLGLLVVSWMGILFVITVLDTRELVKNNVSGPGL